MPRTSNLQIDQRQTYQDPGRQILTEVVARPVDTAVDLHGSNKVAQLTNFLQQAQTLYGTEEAIQTHEGQVAHQSGAPVKETILGAYEKGWMSVDGSVKGTKDAAEAQAQFKTGFDRTQGPEGVEKWLTDKSTELTQGMKPGPFADSYKTHLGSAFDQIRADYHKELKEDITGKAEANTMDMLLGAVTAKTKAGKPVDISDFDGVRKTLQDNNLGISNSRFNELTFDVLSKLASEGNWQAIEAADQKRPDGTPALSSIPEYTAKVAALHVHAQTVFLNKQDKARKAIKDQHDMKVAESMAPLFKLAQGGDREGAQAGFNEAVKSGLFDFEPAVMDTVQKQLLSVGDKGETLDQLTSYNNVAQDIFDHKATPQSIVRAGLSPARVGQAMQLFMDQRRIDSDARNADKALDAAKRNNTIQKSPEYIPTVKDVLTAIPEMSGRDAELDKSIYGGARAQQLEVLRQKTRLHLNGLATDADGDIGKFSEGAAGLRDAVAKRAQGIIDSKDPKKNPPPEIIYLTPALFLAAYKRGEISGASTVSMYQKYFKATQTPTN